MPTLFDTEDSVTKLRRPFILTVVRNPVDRFISGIYEVTRRQTWKMVQRFARREGYGDDFASKPQLWPEVFMKLLLTQTPAFDPHLRPQYLFLLNHEGDRLTMDYIAHQEDGMPALVQYIRTLLSEPMDAPSFLEPLPFQLHVGGATVPGANKSTHPFELSATVLREVCKFYATDFKEFGYPLPDECRTG